MEVLGQRGNHRSRNEKCGLFFPFLLGRFSPGKNDCGKSVHVSSSKLKASFTPQWQPLLAFSKSEVWRGFGTSSDVPIIPPCNRKHLPGIIPRCHPHPATFSIPALIFLPIFCSCHFFPCLEGVWGALFQQIFRVGKCAIRFLVEKSVEHFHFTARDWKLPSADALEAVCFPLI